MADNAKASTDGDKTIIAIVGLFLLIRGIDLVWKWMQLSARNFALAIGLLAIVTVPLICILWKKLKTTRERNIFERSITAKTDDSVFCGSTDKGEEIWIKTRQRAMHTQS